MYALLARASAAIAIVAVCATATVAATSPLKGDLHTRFILVAGTPGWQHAPGFIAQQNGYYRDAGLTGMAFKQLASGTASGEAVGTGAADIGYTSTATAINLISKGAPVTVIAGVCIGGSGVAVGPKSTITSVAELKGKKVAMPQGLTVHEVAFRTHVLPAAGMTDAAVTLVPIDPPNEVIALERGDVDAAVLFEPFLSAALAKGAKLLVPPNKMWGGSAYTAVIIARTKFVADNPAIVQKIIDANTMAVSYIHAHPDEASKTLSELAHQNEAEVRNGLNYSTPVSELKVGDMQALVAALKSLGVIDAAPNMATASDPSFIQRTKPSVN